MRNRTFAPSLTATVATMVMVPLLCTLGIWQLHRAQEKRELTQLAAMGERTLVTLTSATLPQLNRYQRVSARGRYDGKRQVLLDNMPSQNGAPGYRVLTPLILDDGHLVLVDRGWIALGRSRADLPEIDLPDDVVPRTIHGVLDHLPQPGVRLGTAEVHNTWPQVLNFPTDKDVRDLYGSALLPGIVLLGREQPLGFEREWQHAGLGPERHVGYAVQWFGLALTVLIIYVVVNLERRN